LFPRLLYRLMLLLIFVFVALFLFTHFKTKAIESNYPPTGEFVSLENEDISLHYVRAGSGVPVVMLHGRDGTLQEFTLSIFDDLSGYYDVITLDRPGYGYSTCSDPEKLSTKAQAKIINEALNTLEIEEPILIGHSYGGAVMLQYLLDYPGQVLGAISLAGVAYVEEPPDKSFYALPEYPVIGPLLTHTIVLPAGTFLAPNIYSQAFYPAEAPEEYVEVISSLYLRPGQFTATAYELSAMYDSVNAISPDYEQINVPVTIIFGDSDKMLDHEEDGERLYHALPGARYILIENGGHKIHHTHPNIIIEALHDLVELTAK